MKSNKVTSVVVGELSVPTIEATLAFANKVKDVKFRKSEIYQDDNPNKKYILDSALLLDEDGNVLLTISNQYMTW